MQSTGTKMSGDDGGSSEPQSLVLLPGLLCDETVWSVPDLIPTSGWSALVATLTQFDSIEAMADDVLGIAPARFHLIGFSMGGYVALECLRRSPERVASVVLVDTTAQPDPPDAAAQRRELVAVARRNGVREAAERLLPALAAPLHQHVSHVRDRWLQMADHVGADGFSRQQEAIIRRPDARDCLARITCPALVLYGELDALTTPVMQHAMADSIPGAEIQALQGCGHLTLLESRSEAHEIMRDWLDRLGSPESVTSVAGVPPEED